jgi:hypothetical protein
VAFVASLLDQASITIKKQPGALGVLVYDEKLLIGHTVPLE